MIVKRKTVSSAIYLLLIATSSLSPAQDNRRLHDAELQNLRKARQSLEPNHLNTTLLEQVLIHFTNQARQNHRLNPCAPDKKLRNTARTHSEEMARLRYFSHESPIKKNHQLIDRMKNAGLSLGNTTMGENIGVDYFLGIAKVPFYKMESSGGKTQYINAKTEKPIEYQTYWEFARRMVNNWMNSPKHRKVILNKDFDRIGVGVASGTFRGFQAIYVTQNFIGPVKPEQTPRTSK